jgi:hypothetical protein
MGSVPFESGSIALNGRPPQQSPDPAMGRARWIIVLIIAYFFACFLYLQGWRDHLLIDDDITCCIAADALVHHGKIPHYGCLNSFGTFQPPGTAWLDAPGVLLLSDSRLFFYPATLLMTAGTMAGIYRLVSRMSGAPCAVFAACMYAFSLWGFFYGSNLWPRGHPFFVVCLLLAMVNWAQTRRGSWLALGIVIICFGTYIHPEFLPMAVIPVALWLVYRPPIAWRWVGAGFVAWLLVWSPYLQFEWTRNGRDLANFVFHHDYMQYDFRTVFNDPSVPLSAGGQAEIVAQTSSPRSHAFGSGPVEKARLAVDVCRMLSPTYPTSIAKSIFLAFALAGAARSARGFFEARRNTASGNGPPTQVIIFVSAIAAFAALILTAGQASQRFWQCWPFVCIFVAQGIWMLTSGGFAQKLYLRPVLAALTLASLLAGALLVTCAGATRFPWWGNGDAHAIIAAIAQKANSSSTTVSYEIAGLSAYEAGFHKFDPEYKIGVAYDYSLKQWFGVQNLCTAPEGVCRDAEFWVIGTQRDAQPGAQPVCDVPLPRNCQLLKSQGSFRLYWVPQ